MTEKTYTRADYANAGFARHPDGGTAIRTGNGAWDIVDDPYYHPSISTDGALARLGWVPVRECPDPELHEPVGRSTGPHIHASPGLMQTVPESFTRFMAEKDEREQLGRLVQDVRDGDGHTVKIDGVKIARCDTYGRTDDEHAERTRAEQAEKDRDHWQANALAHDEDWTMVRHALNVPGDATPNDIAEQIRSVRNRAEQVEGDREQRRRRDPRRAPGARSGTRHEEDR